MFTFMADEWSGLNIRVSTDETDVADVIVRLDKGFRDGPDYVNASVTLWFNRRQAEQVLQALQTALAEKPELVMAGGAE